MKLISVFLRPLLLLTSHQSSPSFPSSEGNLNVRGVSVPESQQWYQLTQEGYCLQRNKNVNSSWIVDDEVVTLTICQNDQHDDQLWKYEGEKHWLVHKIQNECLAIKRNQIKMISCQENNDADQLWELDGTSLSPKMHWDNNVTTNMYKSGSVVLQLNLLSSTIG